MLDDVVREQYISMPMENYIEWLRARCNECGYQCQVVFQDIGMCRLFLSYHSDKKLEWGMFHNSYRPEIIIEVKECGAGLKTTITCKTERGIKIDFLLLGIISCICIILIPVIALTYDLEWKYYFIPLIPGIVSSILFFSYRITVAYYLKKTTGI